MTRKKGRREGGFTLIELIIVIVILGILAAVAIPKFLSLSAGAEIGVAKGITAAIRGAVQVVHSQRLIANNNVAYTAGEVTTLVDVSPGLILNGAAGNSITAQFPSGGVYTWNFTAPSLPTTMAVIAPQVPLPPH